MRLRILERGFSCGDFWRAKLHFGYGAEQESHLQAGPSRLAGRALERRWVTRRGSSGCAASPRRRTRPSGDASVPILRSAVLRHLL